ncbi:MAG TPA: hypothetical protein PLK94_01170 [Alphaproteobacteria bacterium]|nr:hypothetical protein [Alphaproteobacteria bacterium]
MKRKKKKKFNLNDLKEKLNPIITIDESKNECLFAIVDFSLPGTDHVRRVISKKLGNGNIFAVTYVGTVGPDRTCSEKHSIMEMRDVPQEKFWQSVNVLSALYQIKGGVTEIRNYNGKTMNEAANLMNRLGNAQVWMDTKSI